MPLLCFVVLTDGAANLVERVLGGQALVNLKRLEAAGLLRREIDTADLRRHRLLLTPDGRKAMSRGLTLLSDAFGARLGRLSAAQQASLRTLLEKLN